MSAGLTQEDLSRRVGLSRTSITNMEQGTQHVSLHHLFDLASALGITPNELLPEDHDGTELLNLPSRVKGRLRQLTPQDQEWVMRVVQRGRGRDNGKMDQE